MCRDQFSIMDQSVERTRRGTKVDRLTIRVMTEVREKHQGLSGRVSELRSIRIRGNKSPMDASNLGLSKCTLTSARSVGRKVGACMSSSGNLQSSNRVETAKEEITAYLLKKQQMKPSQVSQILLQIFDSGQRVNQNLYNYTLIQAKLKLINSRTKELNSPSLSFFISCMSGLIFYQYSSLSLSIFYFDRALKMLSLRPCTPSNFALELLIYRNTAKIFLQFGHINQARQMAYMYLRKAWRYYNLDEEMNAYDLLGQVELEEGNMDMCRYFHWRMTQCVREGKQIVQLSNQQLDKNKKDKYDYNVYEDIMIFVREQQQVLSILVNHFRSQAQSLASNMPKKKQVFLYTHRSSNRLLRNHRVLERKLIDEKQSAELHFIRPRDIGRIRKLITQMNCFVFELRRGWFGYELEADMSRSQYQI